MKVMRFASGAWSAEEGLIQRSVLHRAVHVREKGPSEKPRERGRESEEGWRESGVS